jgi:glycosyltransferase involved in cell wall biosynthesis
MPFDFSIIIPTYNRAALLGATLDSIFQLRIPVGSKVELLVIDNNCTDNTKQTVQKKAAHAPFPCRHIVERKQGLCFGRNRGLAEAIYDHLVYFDDDVEINPNWLDAYIRATKQFDAHCVVGPVTADYQQPLPEFFNQSVIDSIDSSYSRKGNAAFVLRHEQSGEVPGCNFGVQREVAVGVGGFNLSLDRIGKDLLAGGDTEFGERLGAAWKRIVYEPQCSLSHKITGEKLTASYIRRRWYGLGLTTRALSPRYDRLTLRVRFHFARKILARALAGTGYLLLGNRQLAFQHELEVRRALGYLNGTRLSAIRLDRSNEKQTTPVHC